MIERALFYLIFALGVGCLGQLLYASVPIALALR
jgi:hypothetical protein